MPEGRPTSAGDPRPPPRGRLFWPAAGVGAIVMLAGVAGALRDAVFTQPPVLAAWILGSALVHDGLIAPVVGAIGTLLTRVRRPRRSLLQAGLLVSGVAGLVAFPFVARFGVRPDDPSALPGNYAAGLGIILATTWVSVAILAWRRRHRDGPHPPPSGRRA